MRQLDAQSARTLEILLVLITLALACVLYSLECSQVVVLNLFFLPVVLAAFFLGCYRAGILALFAVISAASVILCDLSRFSFVQSPISIALSVIVWAAVLGLTAILVGTLSDERAQRSAEADEAHLGLLEVFASYIRSGDAAWQARLQRIHGLSMEIGERMQLSEREIEALRRAVLVIDLENLERTGRLVRRAARSVGGSVGQSSLVNEQSLPDLLARTYAVPAGAHPRPAGSRILDTVRRYVDLQMDEGSAQCLTPEQALMTLREELGEGKHDPGVLFVLEELVHEQLETSIPLMEEFSPPEPAVS